AHRRYMALTRSPGGLISFWSTNSVDWRSEAVTGTRTLARLTTWANGRHGSKLVQEMIRLKLWALPISGSAPAASLVVTEICRLIRSTSHGEEPIFALHRLAVFFLWG